MKVNKTIIIGLISIVIGGIILTSDILNPIIRPVTHLFLMGSSKGKDILFFGLLGLFLIIPQLIKKNYDSEKYLQISMRIGWLLLILGIALEVMFRQQMGIKLNTVFCSMSNTMSSTSILHTHLLKSIIGALISQIMGPFVQSNINTGVGLYSYVPSFGFLVILLIPALFATLILAIRNRPWFTSLLLAFFSSCLIIGAIDGGLFGTPALVGILGLYLVYRNGFYMNYILYTVLRDKNSLEKNEEIQPVYRNRGFKEWRYIFNRFLIWFVVVGIIILRMSVGVAGAETDYYTVDVVNPTDNIDLGDINLKVIEQKNYTDSNKTTYYIDHNYNEMELINDLKHPLKNSCEYYTVTWNIFSYLEDYPEINRYSFILQK